MGVWGDFQGLTGETGGGRGVKNFEKWGDVFYGWSLMKCEFYFIKGQTVGFFFWVYVFVILLKTEKGQKLTYIFFLLQYFFNYLTSKWKSFQFLVTYNTQVTKNLKNFHLKTLTVEKILQWDKVWFP